jgi:hypothetical protein
VTIVAAICVRITRPCVGHVVWHINRARLVLNPLGMEGSQPSKRMDVLMEGSFISALKKRNVFHKCKKVLISATVHIPTDELERSLILF